MFVSGGLNAGLALLGFGLKLLIVRRLTYKELAEATLQFAMCSDSGKVTTVFQITCQQPLLVGEASYSTGLLKWPSWVGQKLAAMQRMEMQIVKDRACPNAVGLNLGAS